jgi:hypothetical protein
LIVLLASCDPAAREPAPAEASKPEPTPVEIEELPAVTPDPPEVVEAVDPPEPTSNFDPATATSARVRIVAVHDDRSWVLCGVIHSTGAIEVEVLEIGEPAPRMILIVSCPVDQRRGLLVVDKIFDVTLYARRQPWPTPAIDRKLPPELPRRYVKSMIEPTSPAPPPAPQSDAAPE